MHPIAGRYRKSQMTGTANRNHAPILQRPTLESLRHAAATCKACDLWKNATQTVFGEGKADARMMMIGEQFLSHKHKAA